MGVTVVTGASSGLGLETVKALAARATSAKQVIVMACRSLVKAKTAIDSIKNIHESTELRGIDLDLSDLQSVRNCAEELASSHKSIDCLICNAGVLIPSSDQITTDGFEINVGTNHLGHVYLIHLLTDVLNAGRGVIVSSILLKNVGHLDLDLLQKKHESANQSTNPVQESSTVPAQNRDTKYNYCQSKLMNALFAKQLAKRFPNLHVYCVSPGWCKTQLHRNSDIPWYAYIGILVAGPIFMK